MLFKWPLPFLLPACAAPGDSSDMLPPSRQGMIHADEGADLFFRVEGHGSDIVVVLHGGPGLSSESLRPDLTSLAAEFTLIYYDQRGSGQSAPIKDSSRVSIAHHIADLEAVRAHFSLDRMLLMGHSWGGGLALRYALEYPRHTRGILLLDPMPLRRDPHMAVLGQNLMSWMDRDQREQLNTAAKAWSKAQDPRAACHAYWKVFLRGYLADPHGTVPVKGNPCHGTGETLSDRIYRYTMEPLGAWDWREEARGLQVPVLIMHGEKSPLPLVSFLEWEAALANGKRVMIPGSGHYPHAESPKMFLEKARAFIRENRLLS